MLADGNRKGPRRPLVGGESSCGRAAFDGLEGRHRKPIKAKTKIGSTFYLATWQGLRGESLDIELGRDVRMTCARTGITFTYTDDLKRLGQIDPTEEE